MDISALQNRLPAIRKWIDTTVEEHRPAGYGDVYFVDRARAMDEEMFVASRSCSG